MTVVTQDFSAAQSSIALVISLQQDDLSAETVDLKIESTVQGVLNVLARKTIAAPITESPNRGGSRIVAFVGLPGLSDYKVTATSSGVGSLAMKANAADLSCFDPASLPIDIIENVAPGPTPGTQPKYIWVATNGNDTTGEVGNIEAPFLTIGAAVAAAIAVNPDPTTIIVAPGEYSENVSVLASASTLKKFSLIACGNVRWLSPGGLPQLAALSLAQADNANLDEWLVQGFTFVRAGTGTGINAHGAAAAAGEASMFPNGLTVRDCRFEQSSFLFSKLGLLVMSGINGESVATQPQFLSCLEVKVTGSLFSAKPLIQVDPSAHVGAGYGSFLFSQSSRSFGFDLEGCVQFGDDSSCIYDGAVVSTVALTSFYDGVTDMSPNVQFRGSNLGSGFAIEYDSEAAAPATAVPTFQFIGCTLGASTFSKDVGPRTLVTLANGSGSICKSTIDFASACQGDLTGASFTQANLTATPGTPVKRDRHVLSAVASLAGPVVSAISPEFPDASYSVSVEPIGAATVAAPVKAAASVTLTASAPATADVTLSYYG